MIMRDAGLFVSALELVLERGHRVRFRAEGISMLPTIGDGDTITVAPSDRRAIRRGDIVLYRHGVRVIAHRIVEVRGTWPTAITFVPRGDGTSANDPPIAPAQILGRVVRIERRLMSAGVRAVVARVRGWHRRWRNRSLIPPARLRFGDRP